MKNKKKTENFFPLFFIFKKMSTPKKGSKTFYNCTEDWKVALSQGRLPQVYGTCKANIIIPNDAIVIWDISSPQYSASKMTIGKMITNGKNECTSGRCYSGTFLPNHTYEFDTRQSIARFDTE